MPDSWEYYQPFEAGSIGQSTGFNSSQCVSLGTFYDAGTSQFLGGGIKQTDTILYKPLFIKGYYNTFCTFIVHGEVYDAGDNIIGTCDTSYTQGTSNWTFFEVHYTYTSIAVPAKVMISFQNGYWGFSQPFVNMDSIQYVFQPTQVSEVSEKNILQVFPNPINRDVQTNLFLNRKFESARYLIQDLSGRILISGFLIQQDALALPTGIAAGEYILGVYDGNKEYHQKVCIQ